MMIERKIVEILHEWCGEPDERIAEVAQRIAQMARDEIEEGIATAIEIRFNGIPQ